MLVSVLWWYPVGQHFSGHLGLYRSYLLRRQNRRAAEAALRTIGLLTQYPMAHYYLGVALHRMGHIESAVDSLTIALSINPNFVEAHQRLAHTYRKRLNQIDKANEHRRLAREMQLVRRKARQKKQTYRAKEQRSGEKRQPASERDHQGVTGRRADHGVQRPIKLGTTAGKK